LDQVPTLKVVMEHITTADATHFVAGAPANVAASVTPQHMLLNRNALFAVSGVHVSACMGVGGFPCPALLHADKAVTLHFGKCF
jgi:dihydroorotase